LVVAIAATACSSSAKSTAPTTTSTRGFATSTAAATTTPPATSSSTATHAPTTSASPTSGKPVEQSLTIPKTNHCTTSGTIDIAWRFANATSMTLSIDGPGEFASYGPSGRASVPFACDGNPHTYMFTATGPGGTTTDTRTVSPGS